MHTVAHIHEMKAEIRDGLEFMQRSETHWKVWFLSMGHLPGKFHPSPRVKPRLSGQKLWGVAAFWGSSCSGRCFCQPQCPQGATHLPTPASVLQVILGLVLA